MSLTFFFHNSTKQLVTLLKKQFPSYYYKIQIQKMGPYLSQPITSKKIITKKFHMNQIVATSCQMQGWRKTMEDASIICQLIQDSVYLFGVFDGHGGSEVSQFVAKRFSKQLLNEPYFKLKHYSKALTSNFKRIDDMLQSPAGQKQLKKMRKAKQLPQFDEKISIATISGCTANVILLTRQKIYCANIGDSRSVLCRKGVAMALSEDHKPVNPIEKTRVIKAGSKVQDGRINGGLNLSRAFGDFSYKKTPLKAYNEQAIISVPQIIEFDRKSDDEFIIMGCDGIWQKYTNNNKEMISVVNKARNKFGSNRQGLFEELFTGFLGSTTEKQQGCDNMTAILIQFYK